ncbi:DVUA0089 family protein [Halocynthiibacter styelae]|uniref:DVUA0089 family protein n=1 Tax=Halocynthiibacter styelae TaxID=2761955 RepID=A0A8J7IM26_9RHOB|nr:DVUA0089 family protein [Paenihalocynthiibacter styelae]MBI1493036.1 DVUA0089 family protein [Paenihalocynthiibacter styelae]
MTRFSRKSLLLASGAALSVLATGAQAQERGACGQPQILTHAQYLITGATAPAVDTVVAIARREPAYIELEVGQRTGVTIETSSGNADPVVVIFNANGDPLLGNDDGAGGLNSLLSIELDPGSYCAQISTYTSVPDGYGTPTGFNENIPLQIRTGLEAPRVDTAGGGGAAASTECFAMPNLVHLDDPVGSGAESLAVNGTVPYAYSFSVEEGTNMSLLARSNTLDTFLTLVDVNGNQIATDDDGGGGTDSHIGINYGLPAGEYCVAVTGYDPATSGPADLTISDYNENISVSGGSVGPANPCGDPATTVSLTAGEHVQGVLSGESQDYTFDLAEPMALRLTATSNSFDTYLWLYTADGVLLNENDDADGLGTGSRIENRDQLPAGSYCASVTPFGGDGTGAFNMHLMELSEEALLMEAYNNAEILPPSTAGVEMTDLGLLHRNLRADNAGGETQWYLFEVEDESFVVVDSASVGSVSEIVLFDYEGSGQRIAASQLNSESLSTRLVKKIGSGIYALAVVPDRSAGAGVGASALSLQRYIRPPRQ